MVYKTVMPADLRPGDRVRHLDKLLTVSRVRPAGGGLYDVEFRDGRTVQLAGVVSMVDEEWRRAILARYE